MRQQGAESLVEEAEEQGSKRIAWGPWTGG